VKDPAVKPVWTALPELVVTSIQYPVRFAPALVCEDTVRLGLAAETPGAERKAEDEIAIKIAIVTANGLAIRVRPGPG
jgi:hypothetical protein